MVVDDILMENKEIGIIFLKQKSDKCLSTALKASRAYC